MTERTDSAHSRRQRAAEWFTIAWPVLVPVAILVAGCVLIGIVNGWS